MGTVEIDTVRALARMDELLQPGLDLELVVKQLVPARRQELLRRAALPRVFDRSLAESVLVAGLPGAATDDDVDWLVQHSDVEPAAGSPAAAPPTLWRMRDSARAERLAGWFDLSTRDGEAAVRAALAEARRLSRALVKHLRRRGLSWEIECLSHMVVADAEEATETMQRLFRASERRNDYTRCYMLLETVEERLPHLDAYKAISSNTSAAARRERLHQTVDELRRRYDTRRTFMPDLEKTALLVARRSMREEWQRLIAPDRRRRRGAAPATAPWIVHLEAQGGSGKTMFLRWLAARKCLPAAVPYARLDFDFVDPRLTRVAPWLLLVRLARQLDPQLPGRPFTELVQEGEELAGVTFAQAAWWGSGETGGAAEAIAALGDERVARRGDEIAVDFAAILGRSVERRRRRPVIFVLDTLEVALLNEEADLHGFVTMLSELHEAVPAVRLILSGRFDLFRRLRGFTRSFGDVTRRLTLGRFDDDEALSYLRVQRKLPDTPATRAIVKRSKGLPFVLSLFADEWQQRGRLTVQEVHETPGPELQYLAERVLKRIQEPEVRWLLRYGVVPRRLTSDFLRDVMLPELRSAMRGRSRFDDPRTGAPPLVPYFQARTDGAAEEGSDDADRAATELWKRVVRHASALSFVNRDPDHEDTLLFHEDVLRPMRRELGRQRVFLRLHRAALRHARSQAKRATLRAPERWERHMRDAMYHAFQLGGDRGREMWRKAIDEARTARAWRAVYGLATELQQGEYVDAGGVSMLEPELRMEAAMLRTDAAVRAAVEAPSDALGWWESAARALEALEAVRRGHPRLRVNRGVLATLRARVAAHTHSLSRARRILSAVRSSIRTPSDRFELYVALADAHQGDVRALRYYDQALTLAAQVDGVWAGDRARLRQRAAEECAAQDRLDLAASHYATLQREWRALPPSWRVLTQAELVNVLVRSGDARRAIAAASVGRRLLDALADAPPDAATAAARGRLEERSASAFRLAGDLRAASRASDGALLAAESLRSPTSQPDSGEPAPHPGRGSLDATALALEARARVEVARNLSARTEWGPALRELRAVRELWADVGYADGVARSLASSLRVHRIGAGDLRAAAQAFDEGRKVYTRRAADGWWLLRYEHSLTLAERQARALRWVSSQLLHQSTQMSRPRQRVLGAVAAAVGDVDAARVERALLRAVGEMRPPASARRFVGALLDPATRLRIRGAARRALLRRLEAGWSSSGARGLPWRDQLDRSVICLALGASEDATRWLDAVRDRARRQRDLLALCEAAPLVRELSGAGRSFVTVDELRSWRIGSWETVSPTRPDSHDPTLAMSGMAAFGEAMVADRLGRRDDARELCDLAVERLEASASMSETSSAPPLWLGRALALRASLSSWGSPPWREDRSRARAIFHRLDRRLELSALAGDAQQPTSSLPARRGRATRAMRAKAHGPPDPLVLHWKLGRDFRIKVVSSDSSAGERRDVRLAETPRLSDVLRAGTDSLRGLASEFADNWPEATWELVQLLPTDPPSRETRDSDPLLVGVVATEPALAALPVECARATAPREGASAAGTRMVFRTVSPLAARREHELWAQRALVTWLRRDKANPDAASTFRGSPNIGALATSGRLPASGRVDAAASRALVEASLFESALAPRACVLAPDERSMRSWRHGHAVQARQLVKTYEKAGFDSELLESPGGEQLYEHMRRTKPDIVHIRAPIHESLTWGGTAVNFRIGQPQEQNQRRDTPLTASHIAGALERNGGSGLRPIVVIDVPLVFNGPEDVRQLLLRNALAWQLFDLRTVVAVVGLGFGSLQMQDLVTDVFVGTLATGESLATTVRAARQATLDVSAAGEESSASRGQLATAGIEAMSAGTALWAFFPNLVYLPSRPDRDRDRET